MRSFVRFGSLALTALVISSLGSILAQTPPATKGTAPPAPAPEKEKAEAAELKQVLGTVNGDPITRGELVNFLNRRPLPNDDPDQIYKDAMDSLVNTHLIFQFLDRKRVPIDQKKIDDMIASIDKRLKDAGGSLAASMIQQGTSMASVRKDCAEVVRWVDYLDSKATDPELQKFFDRHKDYFNGTQVHVSHILLSVDPKATKEEKDKAIAKLKGIKAEIDSKKMTFAEAANKYSDDKTNPDGTGGDIGFVSRTDGFVQEFSDKAFAAKVGVVSEPFETPYGIHILLVTEKKEGPKVDLEQIKPAVKQTFGLDLQKSILTGERATAKIDIKPMPVGLFGLPPTPAATKDAAKKAGTPK
jgi:peptidyl-prolyl cis-trans isomerase C